MRGWVVMGIGSEGVGSEGVGSERVQSLLVVRA